ncbi:hypothetical protein FK178_07555 [Antarcticibacterium arcticum]|uniref:Uncharacterized protein n=1 Tax=Antarcticibacterium arcticum TaxID=2585771 RepID=A0A5B8YI16_9FLAO|nr:hypothetical protein [Antarcticibacterium arcticum]QED37590.1 hypothetical protein FK178_07555 [Antarcticibacterium arcticum]
MIWFSLKKLEKRLAKRELSEHHAFRYLVFYLVIFISVGALPEIAPYPGWNWDISRYVITLVIALSATYTAFRINEKGDNRDFLKRYISIAFVTGIWVFMGVLLLRLIYKIIMFVIPLDLYKAINPVIGTNLFLWISFVAGVLVFYMLLLRSFKHIQKLIMHRKNELKNM